MEKQYVDNDVFRYNIELRWDIDWLPDITVYTKPFPQPWHKDYNPSKDTLTLEEQEDLVQEKYFTQEKINEIKKQLIDKLESTENPFIISCVDTDGGYNVTENQLFKL